MSLLYLTVDTLDDDVLKSWEEFWREAVSKKNDEGEWVVDMAQVMKELHDYGVFMGEVAEVYCQVTGSRISKANTKASVVIAEIEEYFSRQQEELEEELEEEYEPGYYWRDGDALVLSGVKPEPWTEERLEEYRKSPDADAMVVMHAMIELGKPIKVEWEEESEPLDWVRVKGHFDEVRKQYMDLVSAPGVNTRIALDIVFTPLLDRYDSGERTAELAKEMEGVE
jgi:hypothetical protein